MKEVYKAMSTAEQVYFTLKLLLLTACATIMCECAVNIEILLFFFFFS